MLLEWIDRKRNKLQRWKKDGKYVEYSKYGKTEKETYYKDGRCVEMCEGNE